MSISNGSIITAADVKALKAVIANECSTSRRGKTNGTGQNQSNGSLSGYYGAVNSFSPAKDGVITTEQINTMTKPTYKARTDNEKTVSRGDKISLQELNNQASVLAGKGIIGSDTGCNAACTGMCYTGCYSTCSSCTGSCSGSCSGCSHTCTGSCSGGCYTGCSSCTGSCSSSNVCNNCNGNCSGCWSCSGGCEGSGCHNSPGNTVCKRY